MASPSSASLPVSALAPKPGGLSFVEAAALPQSSAIALQGTQWAGQGTRMCVNGAGGGSGAFVIQLAKAAGAHVTGVDNAGKQAWMRELGADEVVDYEADDWTRCGPFDLVLDLVAQRSVWAYRRALAPGGRYRCVGGTVRTLLRVLTAGIQGVDSGRLGMLLAVLEQRVGLSVTGMDVWVTVAGGVRATEPAVDLGIALAVASAYADIAVPADVVVCGEIGLAGEPARSAG